MADMNKGDVPQPADRSKPIPMGMKYHWWYDSHATGAGVNNSPPTNLTGRISQDYSTMSQSPPMGGAEEFSSNARRDSLKNMMHLYDFSSP
jgi:hypothetical protein